MPLTSPGILLIASAYYVLTAALSFFSIVGVIVFVRHGESKLLALAIVLVYIFFFLEILSQSYQTLNSIRT
jgi:hypothetical protein